MSSPVSSAARLQAYANTFSGNPLDRGGDLRNDAAWLAEQAANPDAIAVALWGGKPLAEKGPDGNLRLAYLRADLARDAVGGSEQRQAFLGLWKDTPVFAVDFEGEADPTAGPLQGLGAFEELRGLAAVLPGPEAGIAGAAKSLFDWRNRHRFCSVCGHASEVAGGGWKQVCPSCKAEHFPRVDPVTIMLPVFEGRCLLGRQASWVPGRMSALAGFLEPGESIEEACARETREEAGLEVTRVHYHSSQPWPFPSQLMIGLIAEVSHDQAAPDQSELEAVRWFTREEAGRMIAGETVGGIGCAPPLAIAHHLLKAWAEGFPEKR
ncbi:MAG: NAD(+) diphosphatase [Proteobacteria bacterium]|nr:NAD(+) diphosphatase [Pseudomonadota bacterium]